MTDEWMRDAMSDDTLVAELLLRLKQPISHQSSPLMTASPLEWGRRLPRSKKEGDSTARRSPTTPLSWSGGCGGKSGGGGGPSPSDGYEESSLPTDPHSDVRSKGTGAFDISNVANKRPRRKKTFAELKDEESSLLKERSYLKKELAAVRAKLKEQRSVNQKLKRMKIGFRAEESGATLNDPVAKISAASSSPTQESVSSAAPPSASKRVMPEDHPLPESRPEEENAGGREQAAFVLPDLNMLPDEDYGPEGLLSTS